MLCAGSLQWREQRGGGKISEEAPPSPEAAVVAPIADAGPHAGSKNCTREETQCLLDVVEEILLIGNKERTQAAEPVANTERRAAHSELVGQIPPALRQGSR